MRVMETKTRDALTLGVVLLNTACAWALASWVVWQVAG